jgi:tRNA (uracil-5-)-methyltransferase
MLCEHFGLCGSCINTEGGYEGQLLRKVEKIKNDFKNYIKDEISIFQSPDSHYRARSEFKLWHDGDIMRYAMSRVKKDSNDKGGVFFINECPQVNEYIEALMPKLLVEIEKYQLGSKLFGVDFLSASDGKIVVSLLYHRKLDDAWQSEATKISNILNISIIGRSRKQKVIIGTDYVIETLTIDNESYQFKQIENSFTQPNAKVNENMVTWAIKQFEHCSGDLLELYCGAGNFTIPFARKFNKILATEISKSSINAAKTNMDLNDISNVEFVRMSVEDFVQALDGVREFRRMKEIDIKSYALNNIFVDPPRSGMDEASCDFAARHDTIVYISCNPTTLLRDLERLSQTHTVESMALFDQFAYTNHIEMGVKLQRKF